jgi:hypothetical protein
MTTAMRRGLMIGFSPVAGTIPFGPSRGQPEFRVLASWPNNLYTGPLPVVAGLLRGIISGSDVSKEQDSGFRGVAPLEGSFRDTSLRRLLSARNADPAIDWLVASASRVDDHPTDSHRAGLCSELRRAEREIVERRSWASIYGRGASLMLGSRFDFDPTTFTRFETSPTVWLGRCASEARERWRDR